MTKTKTPETAKRAGIGKKLGIGGGAFIGLLLVAYLVGTSGTFIKSFVLPRVGKAINAKVTATDISVGLFSGLSLKGLQVDSADEPLLKAGSVRISYSLAQLLGGKLKVSELAIDGVEVNYVQNADKTTNLDPILQSVGGGESPKAEKKSAAPQVEIRNIKLSNVKVRVTQHGAKGAVRNIELDRFDVELDQLGNGLTGVLKLSSGIKFEQGIGSLAATDSVFADMVSVYDVGLTPELMPSAIKGDTRIEIKTARGAFAETEKLLAELALELSPAELKQCELKFSRATTTLGSVVVAGPFDLETLASKLKLEIKDIDKNVLNLAGAALGMTFGETKLNSTQDIEVLAGIKGVNASGRLAINRLSIRKDGKTTPEMDFTLNYDARWNAENQTARLEKLSLNGTRQQQPLVYATLAQPMTISLGGAAMGNAPASELEFNVTGLDLADWAPLVGEIAPAGKIDLLVNLKANEGAKEIALTVTETISGLAVKAGTNVIGGIDVNVGVRGKLADMKKFDLDFANIQVRQAGGQLMTLNAAGAVDITTRAADIGASLNLYLDRAAGLLPIPKLTVAKGQVTYSGRISQKVDSAKGGATTQNIKGVLNVADLTASFDQYRFDRLGTSFDVDLDWNNNQEALIRKMAGKISHGGNAAGSIDITGSYNVASAIAQVKIAAAGIDRNLLQPILGPALGGNQIASGTIGLTSEASYHPNGASSVNADIKVKNLLILDAAGALPNVPLDINLVANAALDLATPGKMKIDLKALKGEMLQGGAKGGEFDVTANYDTGAGKGRFNLAVKGVNEKLLAPFASGLLGDKKLRSAAINASAHGQFDLTGQSAVKGTVSVANVVVNDPSGQIPAEPLSVRVMLDGSMDKKVFNLGGVVVKLEPTKRADNELTVTGRVDLTDTNAMVANLLVGANTLDLTRYYDLWDSRKKVAAVPPPPAPPTDPTREPDPIKLPMRNSKFQVKLSRVYLREVDLQNLNIVAAVNPQMVQVTPFTLTANGAPVNASATVDLSVPGYKYEFHFGADKVPVRPLAKTFSPDMGGRVSGDFIGDINIKGAGTTGASLAKTLQGNVFLLLTNGAVYLKEQGLKPAVAKAPAKTMLGRFTRGLGRLGNDLGGPFFKGLAAQLKIPDLTSSPITHMEANVLMGNGNVDLRGVDIKSEIFLAHAAGVTPIAPVLTNSPLNIPIDLWLSRKAAERLTLGSADPNSPYTRLPRLVEIKGTVGQPVIKRNDLAIGQLAFGALGGLGKGAIGDIGKNAGKVIQNLGAGGGTNMLGGAGSLLKGLGQGTKNAGSEVGNVLKGLGGLFGGGAKTATTNAVPANAKTNKPPSIDPSVLFKLNPKK